LFYFNFSYGFAFCCHPLYVRRWEQREPPEFNLKRINFFILLYLINNSEDTLTVSGFTEKKKSIFFECVMKSSKCFSAKVSIDKHMVATD
jgi:hypothetical protein